MVACDGTPRRRLAVPLSIAGVGVLVALTFIMARLTWLHSHDDAYITLTYAASFADGQGLTWRGHGGLGATSPFLALVLGLLERAVPLGIPTWAHVASWTANLLTATVLLLLGSVQGWRLAGFMAGALWLISPAAIDFLGGESVVAVSAVAVAIFLAVVRRDVLLSAALAVAVALRPEMSVAAALIAVSIIAREGLRAGMRRMVPVAGAALALWIGWLMVLRVLTGTAVPQTLAAKQAQADSVFAFWQGGLPFVVKAVEQSRFFYPRFIAPMVVLVALGLMVWILRGRRDWPLVAVWIWWGPCHVLLLAALDVPYYPWYSIPFHVSILVAACLAVEPPRSGGGGRSWGWRAVVGALFLVTVAGNGLANLDRHLDGPDDPRARSYSEVAAWINDRYPPETRVAAFEVGYLGFHGDFHTVDLLGLATPEVSLDAVRRGDFPTLLRSLEPDLLLVVTPLVSLNSRLVGDMAGFLSRYRLEHTQLTWRPYTLVYRSREGSPRGEIRADLLAALADAGETTGLALRAVRGHGVPSLRLDPGAVRTIEVNVPPGAAFFAAVSASDRSGCTVQLRQGDWTASFDVRQHARWEPWFEPLGPEVDGSTRLEIGCDPESGSACLVGIPHIRVEGSKSSGASYVAGMTDAHRPLFSEDESRRRPT